MLKTSLPFKILTTSKKKFYRRVSLLLLLTVSSLTLTSCADTAGTTESGVPLVKSGKLTVCSETSYEPYEFTRDGKFVGFDIDLSKNIAQDLGVDLDIITTGFEAVQSGVALDSAQCDVGISGTTITDERLTKMDFSDSYADDDLGLLVTGSSEITDLDNTVNKSIGVQTATTGEKYAKEHADKANIQQFETAGDMLAALKSGRVDAILSSINVLSWTSKGDDTLMMAGEYDTNEKLGVAVKKGNTKMVDEVNKTLERIKADGEYQRMTQEWFTR